MSLKGAIRRAQRRHVTYSTHRPVGVKLRHFRPGEKVRLNAAAGFAPPGVYLCDYVSKHVMTLRTGATSLGIGPMYAHKLEKAPADEPLIPEPECRHQARLLVEAVRDSGEFVFLTLR